MGVPLPTMLAGISVTLTQAGQQTPVPLLSIQQLSACSNGGVPPPPSPYSAKPDCLITVITVQIPTELIVASGDRPPTTSQLVVNENGTMSEAFTISPVADKLHIMTTCDVFPSPHLIRGSQPVTSSVPACTSLVTHANGDLITASEPAEANEEIVVWAFGLGLTTPASKTGEASPTPAAVLSSPPYVQFDFRPNAGPSRPYINPLIMAPFVPGAIVVWFFGGGRGGRTLTKSELRQILSLVRLPVPPFRRWVARFAWFQFNRINRLSDTSLDGRCGRSPARAVRGGAPRPLPPLANRVRAPAPSA
jgi:hypothetical protein